jgi:hypothetical protein
LNCVLYDCHGRSRDTRSERRHYLNIFPNCHILPE